MNRRVEIKAEQIARMVVHGMKATQIALQMQMSYDGLMRILRQPEYLAIEERVRKGVLGKMDARLEKRAEMNEEVEDTIPDALQVLLDGVRKKRDLKAALELLDRDPQRQFAKAKPTQPVGTQPTIAAIPSEALAQAVNDAEVTHTILKQATTAKPAEA
jgi:hypothetical protein